MTIAPSLIATRRRLPFLKRIVCLVALSLLIMPTTLAQATDSLCSVLALSAERLARNSAEDAAKFAVYAILSNNAYEKDTVKENHLPMPAGWEVGIGPIEEKKIGFSMTVFEKRKDGAVEEVVVAFRGTDQKRDWIQNLLPKVEVQAKTAEDKFGAVFEKYSKMSPAPKLVATGHSLGGGLALHVSFLWKNVEAYAFNSSPRTDSKGSAIANNRFSVYEKGEILAAFRKLTKFVEPKWGDVHTHAFHFIDGSSQSPRRFFKASFEQHGMMPFASNLVRLGQTKSSELRTYVKSNCEPPSTK